MSRPPRLAAAIVPFRRTSSGAQLFWVKRSLAVPFMAGFHSFPGGSVDKDDAALPLDGAAPAEPPAALASAIRELFEETGILLAKPLPPESDRAAMRKRLLAKTPLAELLGGARLDASALVPIGHWITPPFSPIRFDTRFYLVEIPAASSPEVWPGELEAGEWIAPADAVARWERGEALLAPPALHVLRAAASSSDPARWPAIATGIPEANGGEVRRIEMRRGILLVPLRTPTLPPATHTNCYIVGSNRPVIVDPGAADPAEAQALDDLLAEMSREGRKPSRIAITHHHIDHVGGVEPLRRRLKIPVSAHADTQAELEGTVTVTDVVADGALFDTGDGAAKLRALHTPGHSRGHLAFVEEGTRSLLSGDLILGMGTTVIDPPDGDLESYLASLARLAAMPLAALFPGHGPVLASTLDKVREYQKHRQEREEQILAAMAEGRRTPEAIVEKVYADVAIGLHVFAARSVTAHLELLEKRGAVRRVPGAGWERL